MKNQNKTDEWYLSLLKKADIIDYSPVTGCNVLKGHGYQIWERIKEVLGEKLKELDYEDMYFPMFIPHSLLKKEREHYASFAKEAVFCNRAGNKKFDDELIIRPTSECIIYPSIKNWIKTDQDLPLKLNQWCSIVRWEILKPNFPLIRDNEFLWHEAHACFATEKECDAEVEKLHKMYKDFLQDSAAIPVYEGLKPDRRKFAGAKYTLALEALLGNMRSVQIATSHSLGQNFSKAFDIRTKKDFVWQACAGLTTRLLGVLVLVHGDENGLVIPPKIAPVQVAVIGKDKRLVKQLQDKGIRAELSDDLEKHIIRGTPIIIELNKKVMITRRDTMKTKESELKSVVAHVQKLLETIQEDMWKKKKIFLDEHTILTEDKKEFNNTLQGTKGFAKAYWCGNPECIRTVKKETVGSLRLIEPLNKNKRCIICGRKAKYLGVFGQAY